MAEEEKELKKALVTTSASAVISEKAVRVPDKWFWIKDAQGYGSVTVTFATVAFWVTTLAYVLSIFDKIGPVDIRAFDVAAASAYFVPVLTLYFGRKFTEAKLGTSKK